MNQDRYDGFGALGFTGALNDRLRAFYISQGVPGNALNDLEFNWLVSKGVAVASVNDMWARYLSSNPPPWASLEIQALSAIRRNNGTLLMVPDSYVGVFEGSTGITPVDALGDPIGLITDRSYGAGNLGVNTAPTLTVANWTVGGSDATHIATFSDGTLRYQSDTTSPQLSVTCFTGNTIGKSYKVTVTCSAWVSGSIKVFENTAGTLVVGGVGTFTAIIQASQTGLGITRNTTNVDLTISAIRLEEVLGNHVTQATASQKPVVAQNAQGRKTISFDGSNDFLQTGITTGNEGWVCAGLSHNVATTAMAFSGGGELATQAGVCLRMAGGSTGCQLMVSDGTTLQIVQSPTSITPGTAFVYDGGWTASIRFVAVNGAETSTAKSLNCTSTLTARIGGAVSGGLLVNGPMTALVYTPVLPSAADRALIRRWIGSLQGQTL